MKRIVSVLLVFALALTGISLMVQAEITATAVEEGYENILFANGYRGFCVDYGLDGAVAGDTFTVASASEVKSNLTPPSDISNHLKVMLAECFHSFFTKGADGTYAMTTDGAWLAQRVAWHYSDAYTRSDDKQASITNMANTVDALVNSGVSVPDNGYVKKVDQTTEIVFDFALFNTQKENQQCFFAYRITARAVGDPPVFTIPEKDNKIMGKMGDTPKLVASAKGATAYQWQVDKGEGFKDIPGATAVEYTVEALSEETIGYRYRCVATNAYGEDQSSIFTFEAEPPAVVTPTEPPVDEPEVTPTEPPAAEPPADEPEVTPTDPPADQPEVTPTEPPVDQPMTPPLDDTPIDDTPVDDTPVDDTPSIDTSVGDATADDAPTPSDAEDETNTHLKLGDGFTFGLGLLLLAMSAVAFVWLYRKQKA